MHKLNTGKEEQVIKMNFHQSQQIAINDKSTY